jgi:hypothetical protein
MTDEVIYPLHKGAKTALIVVCVLLVVLCVTIPLAAYFFYRVQTAGARLRRTGLTIRSLGTFEVEFGDIERLGVLTVPVVASGVGGALAKARVGGEVATNLVVRTRAGKDKRVIISQFDKWDELLAEVKKSVQVPCEDIKMGLVTWKWPEKTP